MQSIADLPARGSEFIAEKYDTALQHLSQVSVKKFYNPYLDIPWDDVQMQIGVADPRWILPAFDPLGSTQWYRALPATTQANLALERTALRVKVGIVFENIVVRGLMTFALYLPNRKPEFRYVLHEAIEETHHSLMFQEFVNRSQLDPQVLSPAVSFLMRYILRCAESFPELFFIFVLAGEEPIDYEQRKQLRLQQDLHPLMKLMNKIHITEEARHICFATQYLRQAVPRLTAWKRLKLRLLAPLIMGSMGRMFLEPPASLIQKYGIPHAIVRDVYQHEDRKVELRQAMGKVIELCANLGLVTRWNRALWKRFSLIE
jgi:hypothetical protein